MLNFKKTYAVILALVLALSAFAGYASADTKVTGTLSKDGSNVNQVWLRMHNNASGEEYSVWVVNGTFTANLPAGTYQLDEYYDETKHNYVQLSDKFTVNGNGEQQINIGVQSDNVIGTLKVAGQPIQNAWLEIQDLGGKSIRTKVTEGSFALYLEDGNYDIIGYTDETAEAGEFVRIVRSFLVSGGKAEPVNIDIAAKNVSGTIVKGSDSSSVQGVLDIQSKSNYNLYFSPRIINGKFSLYMAAGTYRVNGYWDEAENEYMQLQKEFTVNESGNVELSIPVPAKNVSGTLKRKDGTSIDNVWLNLHGLGTGGTGYSVKVENGNFRLFLEDGDYKTTGFWNQEGTEYTTVTQLFTVEDGQLTAPLNTVVIEENVTGTLKKEDGSLIEKAWLDIRKTNGVGETQWFNTTVFEGEFRLYLEDGTYEASGYWDTISNEFVQMEQTFMVTNGHAEPVALVAKDKNVTGTLLTEKDTPVRKAWMHLYSTGNNGRGYSTTARDGQFSIYLPDGNYKIAEYWDEETQEHYPLDYEFTVINGVSKPTPLQVAAKPRNIAGILKLADGSKVNQVHLQIINKADHEYYNAYVNDGNFKLYLPDGEYEVRGYWDESNKGFIQIGSTFTVSGGTADEASLQIIVPENNVMGTVNNENGEPLDGYTLDISPMNGGYGLNVSVQDGQFSAYLPDGSYRVNRLFDNMTGAEITVSKTFTVENSALIEPLDITVYSSNVHGTLKRENGESISNVYLNIHKRNGSEGYNVKVVDGKFDLYLTDGTYEVNSYWDPAINNQVMLEKTITVTNGAATQVELIVHNPNVKGILKNSDGSLVDGAWLQIHNKTTGRGFGTKVTNGQFSVYLEDGNYNIPSYDLNGSMNVLDIGFTVSNGQPDKKLELTAHEKNVTGTIKLTDGTLPAKGNIGLYREDGNNRQYYNTYTVNGKFSMYLPDGSYVIEHFSSENVEEMVHFEFTVSNGTASPQSLQFAIPPKNVTGTLKKEDSTNITNARLQLQSTGNNGRGYSVSVKNGMFNMYLPDGSYRITEYRDNETQEQSVLIHKFTVSNGELTASIDLISRPKNVIGTLQFHDGSKITNTQLNLYNSGSQTDYNPQVVDGNFSLYLPDGEYKASGFWDQAVQKHVQLDVTIKVIGGVTETNPLIITVPLDNVAGSVQTASGEFFGKGNVNIQNQNKSKGYSATLNAGKFSLHLPDGNYRLDSVYEEQNQENIRIDKEFTVSGGVLQGNLVITLPNPNVMGSLKMFDNSPITNAQLNLYNRNGGYGYSASVKNGSFRFALPDGEYQVSGYWNRETQEEVSLDYPFTVTDGVAQPTILDIVVPQNNVTGTLKKEDGTNITNARLQLQSTGNNGRGYSVSVKNGIFNMYLPDGSYQITEYRDNETQEQSVLLHKFTVSNGQMAASIDLISRTKNVIGTLQLHDGTKVANTYLNLYDTASQTSFNVAVVNGNFGLYLPEGEYYSSGYWDQAAQKHVQLNVTFKVIGGSSEPNPLIVTVPLDNVTGSVQRANGEIIGQGYVNIQDRDKPNGYSVSLNEGKFSMNLPDGIYRLDSVYDDQKKEYIRIDKEFTVTGGVLQDSLVIVLPSSNVTGTLAGFNGEWLQDATLQIRTIGSNGNGFSTRNHRSDHSELVGGMM